MRRGCRYISGAVQFRARALEVLVGPVMPCIRPTRECTVRLGCVMGPSFDIDLRSRTVTVQRTDGKRVEVPLPDGAFGFETNIERFGLRAGEGVLRVGLPGDTTAVVELGAGGEPVEELRAGRPVVYLDQNQWSKLAAWRHGHRMLPAGEAAAAETLAGLVEREELLLPASAGHLVETVPLYGQLRVALASVVLALSRGWQMRNPLHVRLEELSRALAGGSPVAANVFAPSADVFFSMRRCNAGTSGLPAPFGEISAEMTNVLGLYDSMIDAEAIEDEGGAAAAAAAGWARAHAELADRLRAAGADRHVVWQVVHTRLLLDLAGELAQASMSLELVPDEVIERLSGAGDPIGDMPFLARMRQLLFARVRNIGQRWEGNDLVDSIFLSCAAGYADIVIGERSAVGYLRQGRDLPTGAQLGTTLAEGVRLLAER